MQSPLNVLRQCCKLCHWIGCATLECLLKTVFKLWKVSTQAGLRHSCLLRVQPPFCNLRMCRASLVQDKVEVNGKNAHPLYSYLKKATKTGMLLLPDA